MLSIPLRLGVCDVPNDLFGVVVAAVCGRVSADAGADDGGNSGAGVEVPDADAGGGDREVEGAVVVFTRGSCESGRGELGCHGRGLGALQAIDRGIGRL